MEMEYQPGMDIILTIGEKGDTVAGAGNCIMGVRVSTACILISELKLMMKLSTLGYICHKKVMLVICCGGYFMK